MNWSAAHLVVRRSAYERKERQIRITAMAPSGFAMTRSQAMIGFRASACGRSWPRRTARGSRIPGTGIWRAELLIWIYCNPLKSHKTATKLFGTARHWNRISVERLGKSGEGGGAGRSYLVSFP